MNLNPPTDEQVERVAMDLWHEGADPSVYPWSSLAQIAQDMAMARVRSTWALIAKIVNGAEVLGEVSARGKPCEFDKKKSPVTGLMQYECFIHGGVIREDMWSYAPPAGYEMECDFRWSPQ